MHVLGKYPNTFYRVSVKALVRDERGYILACKENSDVWSLPGGGIDHGEKPIDALCRELQEELGIITDCKDAKLLDICTAYVESKESWLMWIVYEVDIATTAFAPGEGVSEAAFIAPEIFTKGIGRPADFVRQLLGIST